MRNTESIGIAGLAVGMIAGSIFTAVVYMTNDTKERHNQANTVPVEQCVAAILSIQHKRGE